MPQLWVHGVLRVPRAFAIGTAIVVLVASAPTARGAEPLTILPVLSSLDWPVSIAFAPDGRWFIAERLTGAIRVVEAGSLRPDPWATLNVLTSGEQGLLGIAVDPRWAQGDRWVYAYHTYDATGRPTNRIVRLFDSGGQGAGLEVVLDGIPASSIHNGGIVEFGPDGTLFATTGDAANGANAQDLGTLAGKVLRMNPDGTVPSDNPFAGTAGANPYLYTVGHRNVFGIAVRPSTSQPFVTENGPSGNDEVNALVPGGNYGWPTVLGVAGDPRFIDPILAFSQTIAPTEATFFTGSQVGNLSGDLVFGDWLRGGLNRVRFVDPTSTQVERSDLLASSPDGPTGILDVEGGPDGYLYFTTPSEVYRVNGTAAEGPAIGTPTVPPWAIIAIAVLLVAVAITALVALRRTRK